MKYVALPTSKNCQNSTRMTNNLQKKLLLNYFLLHMFLQELSESQEDREVEESSQICGH